jgi:hypothetical protein
MASREKTDNRKDALLTFQVTEVVAADREYTDDMKDALLML